MPSIREVLAVEETKTADVFTDPAVESRIERTFGGQIAAQAVAAAQRTVSGKDIHSLHGYFVGPGDASQPIEIRVERIREGKSFANRQVRVYQGDVLLFTLMASFHRDRDRGPQHQDPAPEVPGPEEAARMGGGAPYSTRIILKEWGRSGIFASCQKKAAIRWPQSAPAQAIGISGSATQAISQRIQPFTVPR